jgi:hypothetical protein
VSSQRTLEGPDGTNWVLVIRARTIADHPEADRPLIVELLQPDGRARKAKNVENEFAASAVASLFEELVTRGSIRPRA